MQWIDGLVGCGWPDLENEEEGGGFGWVEIWIGVDPEEQGRQEEWRREVEDWTGLGSRVS